MAWRHAYLCVGLLPSKSTLVKPDLQKKSAMTFWDGARCPEHAPPQHNCLICWKLSQRPCEVTFPTTHSMCVQAMVHSLPLSGVTSVEKSASIIKCDFHTPPTLLVKAINATCSRMDFMELLFLADIRQHISFYITECDLKFFNLSHASVWLLIYGYVFLMAFQQYYWCVMVWCIKHAMF